MPHPRRGPVRAGPRTTTQGGRTMDGERSTQDEPGMVPGSHVPDPAAPVRHIAARERRDVPGEGGGAPLTEALEAEIMGIVPGDSGQNPRACVGRAKSGAPCGIIATSMTPDG